MKKSELYELYSALNVSNDEIISSLTDMLYLKGTESYLFYQMCINNSNIIDDDNFYSIFEIFLLLSNFNEEQSKEEFYNMFNKFISKDYIVSSEDFNDILSTVSNLIEFNITNVFNVDYEDADYYLLKIIEYYFNLLSRNQYEYEKVYEHDFHIISLDYMELIGDLRNTKVDYLDNYNDMLLKRIEMFINIANDDKILELNEEKYNSVLVVATSINDLSELSKFKNKAKMLSNNVSDIKFKELIEEHTDILNTNTIEIIFDKLGIQIKTNDMGEKTLIKSDLDIDEENDILKKVLVKSEEKIIKFN